MRILQIVNPVVPIPPRTMGGAERVVHALIGELIKLGHHVTLLAENSSKPPVGVTFHGIGTYWQQEDTVRNVWSHLIRYGHRYDAIHNHGRLLFHLPRIWGRAPKIHTFHFGDILVRQVRSFLRLRPRKVTFAPCGAWIANKYQQLGGRWSPIHNGLSITQYRANYKSDSESPLVIIGRMDPRKGIPDAIAVARKTQHKLLIAGVIGDQPHERDWFETNVLRHCDGHDIQFIGPVDDAAKQDLLCNARGLLMPIQGSEAFGLVAIEALACGCPIIGYDRYSIPELIQDGKTGFLATGIADMASKVCRLNEIDRMECRRDFEQRFTSQIMASRYLALYEDREC